MCENGGVVIARKKREWYPGASYHLMERGIRKQAIFQEDMDYYVFLTLMKKSMTNNHCIIHAYCMMTNHIHILVKTGDIEIGQFVKQIACNYAIYYNRKYSYTGHVFEGRYKSCMVKEDPYFLQTSRYIHLNPVKAGMVAHPEDYPWSSYRTMLGIADDGITEKEDTLRYFGENGIVGYRDFVEAIGNQYQIHEEQIKKNMGLG